MIHLEHYLGSINQLNSTQIIHYFVAISEKTRYGAKFRSARYSPSVKHRLLFIDPPLLF